MMECVSADLEVGASLPVVTFGPISRAMLALCAGASGDHNPVHIDSDFARSAGLSDVFVPELMPLGIVVQVVTRWVKIDRLRSYGARFVSVTHLHETISCHGLVAQTLTSGDEHRLRLSLSALAEGGRKVLDGEAVIAVGERSGGV